MPSRTEIDVPNGRGPASGSPWRWALPAALVVGWIAMIGWMWSEFWTAPPPEALERERTVRLPTLATFRAEVGRSAVELAFFALAAWPRWRRALPLRLLAAGTAGAIWFVVSAPLALTSVELVHRRWLAAMVAAFLLLGMASALVAGVRALRVGGREP